MARTMDEAACKVVEASEVILKGMVSESVDAITQHHVKNSVRIVYRQLFGQWMSTIMKVP